MNIPKVIINFDSGCNTCHKSLIIVPDNGGCGCASPALPCTSLTPNSPCVECEDPCDDLTSSECTFYSAAAIPALAITTNEKLTSIIIKLSAEIIALKQAVAILQA